MESGSISAVFRYQIGTRVGLCLDEEKSTWQSEQA